MRSAPRQRRPAFDRERGVAIAQALFHARGYDAVTVADLTAALGIVPPSLYAAYGSKLGLFERTLEKFVANDTLPLVDVLASSDPPADVLTALFVTAAKHYTRDPLQRGCMVTEAMRADDPQAAAMAARFAAPGSALIAAYVERFAAPAEASAITDYVLLTLRGLSSYACLGHSCAKLVECARIAGLALAARLPADGRVRRRRAASA